MTHKRTDKERLDWLRVYAHFIEAYQEVPIFTIYGHCGEAWKGRTLRQAIDAAMNAEKK